MNDEDAENNHEEGEIADCTAIMTLRTQWMTKMKTSSNFFDVGLDYKYAVLRQQWRNGTLHTTTTTYSKLDRFNTMNDEDENK
mmetsp:Transcript_11223/g.20537  ORF Transcript_11223/g.20537 Transcript_11223/m.20537 type:complete len:83 (+) Transcript_11223:155-403(+)